MSDKGWYFELASTYSPAATTAVPSALVGLTTLFGMGRGGTPPPKTPTILSVRFCTAFSLPSFEGFLTKIWEGRSVFRWIGSDRTFRALFAHKRFNLSAEPSFCAEFDPLTSAGTTFGTAGCNISSFRFNLSSCFFIFFITPPSHCVLRRVKKKKKEAYGSLVRLGLACHHTYTCRLSTQ